jgi:5-amino-6-(5-phosphoribosylamino)uracil reductase
VTRPGERPYVLVSCAVSLDGYVDDASGQRLLLSNEADFDRVDEVRAGCDAILVGATTVRRDDPRLLVRSAARQEARMAGGRPPTPLKATLTGSGNLDPAARFFTTGDAAKVVYAATPVLAATRDRVGAVADVVDAGDPVDPGRMLADLASRGVRRLMVEGGSSVHTMVLTAGLADELHLVVAPFFVGDSRARRFVGDGEFPWNPERRASLAEVHRIDDVVLLRYALSARFHIDALTNPG